jgi:hypothetical protein
MTIMLILVIVIGVALVMGAVAYTRRSRKNKEPLQLGVGRKIRP